MVLREAGVATASLNLPLHVHPPTASVRLNFLPADLSFMNWPRFPRLVGGESHVFSGATPVPMYGLS